jgi:hypothetical protein
MTLTEERTRLETPAEQRHGVRWGLVAQIGVVAPEATTTGPTQARQGELLAQHRIAAQLQQPTTPARSATVRRLPRTAHQAQ